MKTKVTVLTFLIFSSLFSFSQTSLTLNECVELAFKNNPELKSSYIQPELIKIDLAGAKYSMLPSISMGINHGYNFGRSIDRFTNQFATQRILTDYFNMSANMVVFDGFQKQNTIKQHSFNYKAGQKDLEAFKNQIALNTASAYLSLLMAKEMVKSVELQEKITENQLEQTKKLVESGAKDRSAELTLLSQLANEQLSLTEAKNQMEIAKVNLLNIIILPPSENWDVVYPEIQEDTENTVYSSNQIYQNAVRILPEIKSAEYKLNSSEYSEKISKGMLSPTISVYANMSTVFSQNAIQINNMIPSGVKPIGFVQGTNEVVMQPTFITETKVIPFGEQLDNNFGQTIGVSLNWNIFNGMYVRNNIKKSIMNTDLQKNSLEQNLNILRANVTKAVADYNASVSKRKAAQKAKEAALLQMDFMQKRFDSGLESYFDYTNIKNQLMKSEIAELQSKYELIFNKMVVEFYNGNGIDFR